MATSGSCAQDMPLTGPMESIRRVVLSCGRVELRIPQEIKSLDYLMRERVRGQEFDMGIDRRGISG